MSYPMVRSDPDLNHHNNIIPDIDKRKNLSNKGLGIPGKFVYSLRGVSKHLDDGRPILEDLNLQFYLGQVLPYIDTRLST